MKASMAGNVVLGALAAAEVGEEKTGRSVPGPTRSFRGFSTQKFSIILTIITA